MDYQIGPFVPATRPEEEPNFRCARCNLRTADEERMIAHIETNNGCPAVFYIDMRAREEAQRRAEGQTFDTGNPMWN